MGEVVRSNSRDHTVFLAFSAQHPEVELIDLDEIGGNLGNFLDSIIAGGFPQYNPYHFYSAVKITGHLLTPRRSSGGNGNQTELIKPNDRVTLGGDLQSPLIAWCHNNIVSQPKLGVMISDTKRGNVVTYYPGKFLIVEEDIDALWRRENLNDGHPQGLEYEALQARQQRLAFMV